MSDKSQKSKLKSDKSMLDSQKTITEFEPVLSWSHYCELLKTNPKNVEIKFQNYYII